MKPHISPQQGLILVLLAFLVLGSLYATSVPLFEKPDEVFHYFFVQHLLDERSLPVLGSGGDELWEQEGAQPPLYYALTALVVSPVDTSNARDLIWRNPQRNLGNPADPGNKNFMVHTEAEDWPFHQAALAVMLARWFSLLLGAGTIAVTFLIGRQLFVERPWLALGAAAFTAFVPQFLFISSSVSNDNLINLLSALSMLQLVKIVKRQAGIKPGQSIWLGITLGLAALTKLSGATLAVPIGLVLVWTAWQQRSWRQLLRNGAIIAVLVLAIAGWWYLRNLILYHDLTALNVQLATLGGMREKIDLSVSTLFQEWVGLRSSFWGLFGWFSILMPNWVYLILDLFSLLGLGGLVYGFARSRSLTERRLLLLLTVWPFVFTIALIRWTIMIAASQGRLLFPTLPAIALLIAFGWSNCLPRRYKAWRDRVPLLVAAGLFVLSAAMPNLLIAPIYQRPPLLAPDDLPADLARVDVTFDNLIQLHGCRADVDQIMPGETLAVTCYWQALAPIHEDYFLFQHLLGRELEPIGKEHGYPGSGSFPTSLWPTGRVIASTESLVVDRKTEAPTLGRLSVGVFDPITENPLTPFDPQNNELDLVLVQEIKVAAIASTQLPVPNPIDYTLADTAKLVGYQIETGDSPQIILYWAPSHPSATPLTVFIHLVDENGTQRGQGDGAPLNNDYPTTLWASGELLADTHAITFNPDAPAGSYQVTVGLYNPADGTRLPVTDASGQPLPDNQIILPDYFVLDR